MDTKRESLMGGNIFKVTAPDGRHWLEDREGNEIPEFEDDGFYGKSDPGGFTLGQKQVKGQFELLMADLEGEIANAEGGWKIDDWFNCLTICQRESTNPRMSNNGGDYYFYKNYKPTGLGIDVWESWSCDIQSRTECGGQEYSYDVIVGLDGLRRMAQLADVTIAARAWLAKEPESMKKLKRAIRSLGE